MANSLENTFTSSYAGELALPYIAPAILSADSIAKRQITVHEGIKKQAVMKRLSGGTLMPFACDWQGNEDDLTLDEAILTPTRLKLEEQFCKDDFRQDWEAKNTGKGFLGDKIPDNFRTFMLLYLARIAGQGLQKNLWHGNYNETDGSVTGGNAVTNFSGILARVVAGTPGYESLVAGAFTADAAVATGILTHMTTLVSNMPSDIEDNEDVYIYMSRKSLALLQRAMSGLAVTSGGFSPTFVGENRPTMFLGYEIVTPNYFPNDTLLASTIDNLHFGTDLLGDWNKATYVDMTQTEASDNVRVAMRFTGGTQIGFLSDVAVIRRSS